MDHLLQGLNGVDAAGSFSTTVQKHTSKRQTGCRENVVELYFSFNFYASAANNRRQRHYVLRSCVRPVVRCPL